MAISYTPTYYSLPRGRSTGEETPGPVASTEAFYQEQQDGRKHHLHSLNAFAGRNVVDFTALVKGHNDYYIQHVHIYGRDFVRDCCLLKSMDDLETGNKRALINITCFISENKKLFQLPEACTIKDLRLWAPFQKKFLQEAIDYIDTHPSIHRVLSTSSLDHAFTFRKDLSGQWRVIDSWNIYHDANEQDPIKHLQPAFPTFKKAVEAHFTRLGTSGDEYTLIYPSEDTIPTEDTIPSPPPVPPSPPLTPVSNTTEQPKIRQACCLVRLWDWLIARICALFCCRRSQ